MVEKELSLTKFAFLIICVITFGCSDPKSESAFDHFEKIDISQIPDITIFEHIQSE